MPRKRKHDSTTFIQDPIVANWLKSIYPNTARSYSIALLYFTVFTGRTPRQLIEDEEAYGKQDRLKRDTEQSARHRLTEFQKWLQEDHPEEVFVWLRGTGIEGRYRETERSFKKMGYKTTKKIVGSVKSFYSFYELAIPRLRVLRRDEPAFVSTISTNDIRLALEQADLRTKALILVAATTGRSTIDLLKLRVSDIDLESFPQWGFIHNPEQRRQKTKVEMISWITPEAVLYVSKYLETRPKLKKNSYLFTESRNEQEKKLTKTAAGQLLRRLAKRVFPDAKENPLTLRALRSWFGTQLDHNPGGYMHKQILMGHSLPYGRAYSKPDIKELFESVQYLFDEGYTRILAAPDEYRMQELESKLREELIAEIQEGFDELARLTKEASTSQRLKEFDEGLERIWDRLTPEERAKAAVFREQAPQLLVKEDQAFIDIYSALGKKSRKNKK